MFENSDRIFRCDACGETAKFSARASVSDPSDCPFCERAESFRHCGYAPPSSFIKDQCFEVDPANRGINLARGVRTPEQQEQVYAKQQDRLRKRVRATRGAKANRPSGDMRLIGAVPRELFMARRNQFGSEYWTENDARKTLKRENLLLDG